MSGISLSSEETERYARHIVMPEIGGTGQQKLKAAKVLVVGAGGLGAPAIQYLAAAGIGTLGIVDNDHVSLSNLQRQIIHTTSDVGLLKTGSAQKTVQELNPHVTIEPHSVRLDQSNADEIISPYDLVIDGSDNFATRYVIADAAEAAEVPLVFGAVSRFDGQLTMFAPYLTDSQRQQNPGYRDLFPAPPKHTPPTCAQAGVLGAVTGVIGTLQAMEAVKWITRIGTPLIGRLLIYEGLSAHFREVSYRAHKP